MSDGGGGGICGVAGLKGVGEDSISLDPCDTTDYPNHMILLGAGLINTENLTGLETLVGKTFTFLTLPLKWEHADGSSCRPWPCSGRRKQDNGQTAIFTGTVAGEAVGSGAEDHPAQRYGLSRLAGAEAVPGFPAVCGKAGTIIAVTGTNGKTTVSNLLTDILEADGRRFSATAPAPTSPPASPRRCCGLRPAGAGQVL